MTTTLKTGLVEIPKNATPEDLMKMWPEEPTLRQAISERLKGGTVSHGDCSPVGAKEAGTSALAARRPGVTGLGMKFEYPDGTVRDKWGNIIKDEEE